MSRENTIWLVVLLIGAAMLIGRMTLTEHGMGKAYVREVPINADAADASGRWSTFEKASYGEYVEAMAVDSSQTVFQFSLIRTIGIWVAALFTLFTLSFLIKDNPLYKIAESVFVGVSAAYWMVVAAWDTITPNLFGKLAPGLVRAWAMPGLGADEQPEFIYIVPLILGGMLLWRLSPVGGWISRWPMAFFIGTFCGLRLIRFLQADFLSQIRNGIVPLWVTDPATGGFDFWDTLKNVFLVFGVLACLVYFFFSFEHKGVVGHTARVGIWVLMVTFGAAFGYTVMGRIALLAIRIEFLFDDWLWIIDPTDQRQVESVTMMMQPALSAVGLA